MSILGVPNVRVLKPVHVDLERVIRMHVHVGNEEKMCDILSAPLFFDPPPPVGGWRILRTVSYLGSLNPPAYRTNWLFFVLETIL